MESLQENFTAIAATLRIAPIGASVSPVGEIFHQAVRRASEDLTMSFDHFNVRIIGEASLHERTADHSIGPGGSPGLYIGQIPDFVEGELARLYGHAYSSLQYFRLFKNMEGLNTYAVERNGEYVTILLFQILGNMAYVLNEIFGMTEDEIRDFSGFVFAHFPTAKVVSLREVETNLEALPYPFQAYGSRIDFVLHAPPTDRQYTEQLGKATRRNVNRYTAKLAKDHPTFECRIHENSQVDARHVAALIEMSAAKMAKKGKHFAIDQEYARKMVALAKETGFVTVATIDGEICAGLVSFRLADHIVAHVVAHDPKYDDYWLGTLCYYLTICEAIRRGVKVVNMGQLYYDYKVRLLGVPVELKRIAVYRSRAAQLSAPGHVWNMAAGQGMRAVKLWLMKREHSMTTRVAVRTVGVLRRLRHGE